jgi:hypothetical protein
MQKDHPAVTVNRHVRVGESIELKTEFRSPADGLDGGYLLRTSVEGVESDDQAVLRELADAGVMELAAYEERVAAKRKELAGDPEYAVKLMVFFELEREIAAYYCHMHYGTLADAVVILAAKVHAAQKLCERAERDYHGVAAEPGQAA